MTVICGYRAVMLAVGKDVSIMVSDPVREGTIPPITLQTPHVEKSQFLQSGRWGVSGGVG